MCEVMTRERKRRAPRPWKPLPGMGEPADTFDAAVVLDELRSAEGLLVWQSLRDVDLWSGSGEGGASLFSAGSLAARHLQLAELGDPRLRECLAGLAEVLQPGRPPGGGIAAACTRLAEWASERGYERSAFSIALRAVRADPACPAHAYAAGVFARRAADYVRAELWFRRTLRLGSDGRDPRSYAYALLGLAALHMQRFQGDAARGMLRATLGTARRHGVWEVKGRAYHDLFCIEAAGGPPDAAVEYARAAFRAYGRYHPNLVYLAHDLALFLGVHAEPSRVLPLLVAVADRIGGVVRVLAISAVARVAGAAGRPREFLSAWRLTWQLLDGTDARLRAAESLINLARGAESLGDAERVEVAAREALRIARERDEAQHAGAAEEMLGLRPREDRSVPVPAAGSAAVEAALRLADQLLDAILQTPTLRETLLAEPSPAAGAFLVPNREIRCTRAP